MISLSRSGSFSLNTFDCWLSNPGNAETPTASQTGLTLIPTPSIPLYDDFESTSLDRNLWGYTQYPTDPGNKDPIVANGAMIFEASSSNTNIGFRKSKPILEVDAMITMEKSSGAGSWMAFMPTIENQRYDLQLVDCRGVSVVGFDIRPSRQLERYVLPEKSCPSTHLLGIRLDGTSIFFYLDGQLLSSHPFKGKMYEFTMQMIASGPTKVTISDVWVKLAD